MSASAYEKAVAFLRAYRELTAEARRLCEEIERWRSIAERVTPSLSELRFTVTDGSRIENAVEKIDALRDSMAAQMVELVGRRIRIEQAIDAIPDGRLRLLLRYRYIDGMTFELIAEEMGLSTKWVRSLHKKALEFLEVPL